MGNQPSLEDVQLSAASLDGADKKREDDEEFMSTPVSRYLAFDSAAFSQTGSFNSASSRAEEFEGLFTSPHRQPQKEPDADADRLAGERINAELQQIISGLAHNTEEPNARLERALAPLTLMIGELHFATCRQHLREQRARAQAETARPAAPALPATAKFGLQSVANMMGMLIQSASRSDSKMSSRVLDMANDVLASEGILSLGNGSLELSAEISDSLQPIVNFFASMVAPGSPHDAATQNKALAVLIRFALARGSLSQLLALVVQVLKSPRQADIRVTASLVNPLYRHARPPENKNMPAVVDANAFPVEPAQTLRKFGTDFKAAPDHQLDAPSFVLILLSQLDRISRAAFPIVPEYLSSAGRSLPNPNNPALLYFPLALEARPNALSQILAILTAAGEAYTVQTADERKAAPSAAYLSRTYLLIPALRLLKLHVHQLALARAPFADFAALQAPLRTAVVNLLSVPIEPTAHATHVEIASAVQTEAGQALAFGLEFFFPNRVELLTFVGDAITKLSDASSDAYFSSIVLTLTALANSFATLSLTRELAFLNKDTRAAARKFVTTLIACAATTSARGLTVPADAKDEVPKRALKRATDLAGACVAILEAVEKHLQLAESAKTKQSDKVSKSKSDKERQLNELKARIEQKNREAAGRDQDEKADGKEENKDDNKDSGGGAGNEDGGGEGDENEGDEGDDNEEDEETPDGSGGAGNGDGPASPRTPRTPRTPRSARRTRREPESDRAAAAAAASGGDGDDDEDDDNKASSGKKAAASLVTKDTASSFSDALEFFVPAMFAGASTLFQQAIAELQAGNDIAHAALTNESSLPVQFVARLITPLVMAWTVRRISSARAAAVPLLPAFGKLLEDTARLSLAVQARPPRANNANAAAPTEFVIECSHPYRPFADREMILLAPTAAKMQDLLQDKPVAKTQPAPSEITITFDTARCATASENDYVQLFSVNPSRNIRQTAISEKFWGSAANGNWNWPTKPLTFKNQHVLLYFHTTTSRIPLGKTANSHYGFRANVSIVESKEQKKQTDPVSWLSTLAHLTSWLCGAVCSFAIKGPAETAAEAKCSRWLKSGLFCEGMEDVADTPEGKKLKAKAQLFPGFAAFASKAEPSATPAEAKTSEGKETKSEGKADGKTDDAKSPSKDKDKDKAKAAPIQSALQRASSFLALALASAATNDETKFISELLAVPVPDAPPASSKTLGAAFVERLKASGADRTVVRKAIQPLVDMTCQTVMAVLLKQSGRVGQAISIAQDPSSADGKNLPEAITGLWKKACELKMDLRTTFERSPTEAEAMAHEWILRASFLLTVRGPSPASKPGALPLARTASGEEKADDAMPGRPVPLGRLKSSEGDKPSLSKQMSIYTSAKSQVKMLRTSVKAMHRLQSLMRIRTEGDETHLDAETLLARTVLIFLRDKRKSADDDDQLDLLNRALATQRKRAKQRLVGLTQTRAISSRLHDLKDFAPMYRDHPIVLSERLLAFLSISTVTTVLKAAQSHRLHLMHLLDSIGTTMKEEIMNTFFTTVSNYLALSGHAELSKVLDGRAEEAKEAARAVRLSPTARLQLLHLCAVDVDFGTPPPAQLSALTTGAAAANMVPVSLFRALTRARDLSSLGRLGVVSLLQPLVTVSAEAPAVIDDKTPYAAEWYLRASAWAVLRLLAYASGNVLFAEVDNENESGAYTLHVALLTWLRVQLKFNQKKMLLNKDSDEIINGPYLALAHGSSAWNALNLPDTPTSTTKPATAFTPNGFMAHTIELLWAILRCCQSPLSRKTLANADWLEPILAVATSPHWRATFLPQMLAIRICRHLLPLTSPADAFVTGAAEKKGLLLFALDAIGAACTLAAAEPRVDAKSPKASIASDFGVAEEWVALLRVLLQSDSWTAATNALLAEQLRQLSPKLASVDRKPDDPQLGRVLAALWVLGGGSAMIREGARVLIETGAEPARGTIISLKVNDDPVRGPMARIWVDSDPSGRILTETRAAGLPTNMSRALIAPIDDVAVPLAELSEPAQLIRAAADFLKECQDVDAEDGLTNADGKEVKTADAKVAIARLLRTEMKHRCVKTLNTLIGRADLATLVLDFGIGPLLVPLALVPVEDDSESKEADGKVKPPKKRTIAELEKLATYLTSLIRGGGYKEKPKDPVVEREISALSATIAVHEWICPTCTLINDVDVPHCEVCTTERPKSVQPRKKAAPKAEDKPASSPAAAPPSPSKPKLPPPSFEAQLAFLGYPTETCQQAVKATEHYPMSERLSRAVTWLLNQDESIQPAGPAAYSFLAGKYVPELPTGMFNPIQWYMQAYSAEQPQFESLRAPSLRLNPESPEFVKSLDQLPLVSLYDQFIKVQMALATLHARRALLSLLHKHQDTLREHDTHDESRDGKSPAKSSKAAEAPAPAPAAPASGAMPGFIRAVSLASNVQHALSSFGPPGFLAKFVALLCSAPGQLGFVASVKHKDNIGLDTLREVVVAILGAEKHRVEQSEGTLTAEELKGLAPIGRHLVKDTLVHLISLSNGSTLDVQAVLSTVEWTFDVFFHFDDTRHERSQVSRKMLEFLFCPPLLMGLLESVSRSEGEARIHLLRLLSRIVRLQTRMCLAAATVTEAQLKWFTAVRSKFNVLKQAMVRVLDTEIEAKQGVYDQRGSFPHTKMCKALIDVCLSYEQWDAAIATLTKKQRLEQKQHSLFEDLVMLERVLRSLVTRGDRAPTQYKAAEKKGETKTPAAEPPKPTSSMPPKFVNAFWTKIHTALWEDEVKALQLKRAGEEKNASMSMEQKLAEWNKKAKGQRAEWSCKQCTLLNPGIRDTCEVCEWRNDKPAPMPEMPAEMRAQGALKPLELPKLVVPPIEEFDKWNAKFTGFMDESLIAVINERSENDLQSDSNVDPATFTLTKKETISNSVLNDLSDKDIKLRIGFLMELNRMMFATFRLVDMGPQGHMRPSVAALFAHSHVRRLFLMQNKQRIWEKFLLDTCKPPDNQPEFQVPMDMFKSQRLWQHHRVDKLGEKSVFGQVFQIVELGRHEQRNKYGDKDHDPFRFHIGRDQRAWRVMLKGLNAVDVGGPYREVIYQISRELQSTVLQLFIPSPNTRDQLGKNQESWVPNPSATNPLQLSMYKFVGKLMGLAVRTREFLQLDLPSIVWKQLVGTEITENDVLSIDGLSFSLLDQLKKVELEMAADDNFNPDRFNEAMSGYKFTVVGSDQKTYPLVENGANISITWDNREEFAAALINFRKHEFKVQTAAIREGLSEVLPMSNISIFTWQELRLMVCGRPKIDIALLKSVTQYEGCSSADPHIQRFWRVMEERFDDRQRAQFIQFVWGRSRLPLHARDFDKPFKISRLWRSDASPDKHLPVAHTCFFSIDLPRYSSVDIMFERLLYAISEGSAIDADNTDDARWLGRQSNLLEESDDEEEEEDDAGGR